MPRIVPLFAALLPTPASLACTADDSAEARERPYLAPIPPQGNF